MANSSTLTYESSRALPSLLPPFLPSSLSSLFALPQGAFLAKPSTLNPQPSTLTPLPLFAPPQDTFLAEWAQAVSSERRTVGMKSTSPVKLDGVTLADKAEKILKSQCGKASSHRFLIVGEKTLYRSKPQSVLSAYTVSLAMPQTQSHLRNQEPPSATCDLSLPPWCSTETP